MTIIIETSKLTGYTEERLVEEITTSIELLGIETDAAQVKVLQTPTTTLVENAENAISFFTGLELDYQFANEWDNDEEIATFEQKYRQALQALETITDACKLK